MIFCQHKQCLENHAQLAAVWCGLLSCLSLPMYIIIGGSTTTVIRIKSCSVWYTQQLCLKVSSFCYQLLAAWDSSLSATSSLGQQKFCYQQHGTYSMVSTEKRWKFWLVFYTSLLYSSYKTRVPSLCRFLPMWTQYIYMGIWLHHDMRRVNLTLYSLARWLHIGPVDEKKNISSVSSMAGLQERALIRLHLGAKCRVQIDLRGRKIWWFAPPPHNL